jgi:PHD/YefM family antitoxin component YafN of YafNO toxin-antitoxin module
MKQTNAEDFRSKLKAWMEKARKQPVKITRKTGEAFILIEADQFLEMSTELIALRGQYQGLLDAFHGRTTPITDESLSDLFARVKTRVQAINKTKKAIG